MNRFALTTLYRSLTRHKLYAALNISGLALGIAVFLVLSLYVRFETSFDRTLPHADQIWTVDRELSMGGGPPISMLSQFEMLPLLQTDYRGLEGARMQSGKVAVQAGEQAASEQLALVDPSYFRLFPLPVISGDPKRALARPDGAVVTQTIARRYLGSGNPLGQTLDITLAGERRSLRVGAVIADLPSNMTYRNDIFARLPTDKDKAPGNSGGISGTITFLRFPDAQAAHTLEAQLPAFRKRHPDPDFVGPANLLQVHETIEPLSSLHLKNPRDGLVVATLGIVGLVALALAIVNYINLATARGDLRAREVAVRKVVGAQRTALIRQFLVESLAAAAIAGLVGLILMELTLPLVNAAGGTDLAIDYTSWTGTIPLLIGIVLVTGITAGLYPAFVLSRFRPAGVLSATQAPGLGRRGKWLRTGLVLGQFAIATSLMIGTAILLVQAHHLQTSDLGFERDGLAMVPAFGKETLDPAQRTALRRGIAAVPGVTGTAVSAVAPGGGSVSMLSLSKEGSDQQIQMQEGMVGENFLSLYGARIVAGRGFQPDAHPADISPPEDHSTSGTRTFKPAKRNAVINRTAVRVFGFSTPEAAVGSPMPMSGQVTIIGVVDDIRFGDPREAVPATAYYLHDGPEFTGVLSVRYSGDDATTLAAIARVWRAHAGTVPFDGITANRELYTKFYEADLQRSRLFAIGAVLAVVIGCLGLYGLASFDTARRRREIGIRKSLGASSRDIVRLLVGQFLRPVVLANLIAWPLAFFAMRKWLAGFADRIALSPWFFVGASLLAMAIAVLTVLAQALRASRTPPAWALRHD